MERSREKRRSRTLRQDIHHVMNLFPVQLTVTIQIPHVEQQCQLVTHAPLSPAIDPILQLGKGEPSVDIRERIKQSVGHFSADLVKESSKMFRKFFEPYSELHVFLFISFPLRISSLFLLRNGSLLITFFISPLIILEIIGSMLEREIVIVAAVFAAATNPAAAGGAHTIMACTFLCILLVPAADAVKISALIPLPFYNVCNLLHRPFTWAVFGSWRHRNQRGNRNMLLVVVASGLRHLILDAQSIKRQPFSLPPVVCKVARKEEAIKEKR
mmetsp:Transcript_33432/g.46665  ORF Transcript_33432/g.46665 Transcript_33432/m.46665 type:complete len:271 (+) Transcript_33432:277-1089(+)